MKLKTQYRIAENQRLVELYIENHAKPARRGKFPNLRGPVRPAKYSP